MLIAGVLSLVLMLADHYTDALDTVRSGITVIASPLIIIADAPGRTVRGLSSSLQSRDSMAAEISVLRDERLLLKAKAEKMAALTAENNRLRDLLGSAAKLQDNVLVAELIGVDPNPEKHEVVIDKGLRDNVYVGQPVLDAEGLMGQVIESSPFTSRVLLISDLSHSIPVQVTRSNLRLIAQGTGLVGELSLNFVQATADIEQGDVLVSSGLGGRFPTGYPVGVVSEIRHDPGEPFASVKAAPTAFLDRSRHVLLVFTEEHLTTSSAGVEGNR